MPTHSENLRSTNYAVDRNIIPDAELNEDEEIDYLLLASFDEMENKLMKKNIDKQLRQKVQISC